MWTEEMCVPYERGHGEPMLILQSGSDAATKTKEAICFGSKLTNRNIVWPTWVVINFLSAHLKKKAKWGFPLWWSRLRIPHCHCSSLSHCCGVSSVLAPGTFACHRYGQNIYIERENKYIHIRINKKGNYEKEQSRVIYPIRYQM